VTRLFSSAALPACCVFLLSASAFCSGQERWQAGASVFTESGDYGTGSKTTTTYVPFTLRRYFTPGELELVVPYISVVSEGQVVVVDGQVNPGGKPIKSSTGSEPPRLTHSGLGDMLFKGRYYLLEEQAWYPEIDAVADIKFPTASRSDGLGTGAFDEGLGLESTRKFLERYVGLAELGYDHIGNLPDQKLNDQWRFSLGGGYYFIPDTLMVSASYEQSNALVDGEPSPKDLLFDAEYHATAQVLLQGGLEVGLSDGAPDYGLNIGVRAKFGSISTRPATEKI